MKLTNFLGSRERKQIHLKMKEIKKKERPGLKVGTDNANKRIFKIYFSSNQIFLMILQMTINSKYLSIFLDPFNHNI
jgi:hypothetical protein